MTSQHPISSTLDLAPLLHRTMVRQAIDRDWRGHLSIYEYSIVTFVFDRTVSWGKGWEIISLTEFSDGRANHFSGTGISRAKVIRCLTDLVHRGIIHRNGRNTSRKRYALNLDWTPDMPLPPRKSDAKLVSGRAQLGSHRAQLGSDSDPLKENYKTRTSEEGTERAAPSPVRSRGRSALKDVEDAVLKQGAERRVAKATSRDVNDVQAEWEILIRENWPEAAFIPWSPKTRGLYRTAVKNRAFGDVEPAAFLRWIVEEWGLVMNSSLAWMKDSPEYPHPEFVMIHLYRLLPVYADRVNLRKAFDEHGADAVKSAYRRRGHSAADAEAFSRRSRDKAAGVPSKEQAHLDAQRRALDQEKRVLAQQRRHFSVQAPPPAVDTKAEEELVSPLQPLPQINFDEEE